MYRVSSFSLSPTRTRTLPPVLFSSYRLHNLLVIPFFSLFFPLMFKGCSALRFVCRVRILFIFRPLFPFFFFFFFFFSGLVLLLSPTRSPFVCVCNCNSNRRRRSGGCWPEEFQLSLTFNFVQSPSSSAWVNLSLTAVNDEGGRKKRQGKKQAN